MADPRESLFFANKTLNIMMLWLFCITLMLLFLPLESVSTELADQVEKHKTYLYLALIIEASNFISQFVIAFIGAMLLRRMERREKEYMERIVKGLDFAERALLREFVLQRKSVLYLPEGEPVVHSLLESGILAIAGDRDETTERTPVIISKVARPFITYRAIGLTRGKMNEEMLEQIMNARPEFAREKKVIPRAYRGIKAA